MVSPPAPRPAGPKKIATYGSSSRKRLFATAQPAARPTAHSTAQPTTQPTRDANATSPSIARKPQTDSSQPKRSRPTDDARSPLAKSPQKRPESKPTGDKPRPAPKQNDGKLKRDHSTAFRVKPPMRPANSSSQERKTALNGSHTVTKTPTHRETDKLVGTSKLFRGKNSTPSASLAANRMYDFDDEEDADAAEADKRKRQGVSSKESRPNNGTPPTARRRRLIDSLAAQKAASPDSDSDDNDDDDNMAMPVRRVEPATPSISQPTSDSDLRPRRNEIWRATPASNKIKYTYSQARVAPSNTQKPLDELEPPGLEMDDEAAALADTQALSSPIAPAFDEYDMDDDDDTKPAIKSVHELRRAGANNRFSDEMDDLLGRIGTPGSTSLTMRRNALCELAHRLRKESFAGQFRDHVSRDNIAESINKEEDVINGFALAAALVVFLQSAPAPHLLRQLGKEGLGTLLGRLFRRSEDIDAIASQKATNLPRTTRASVHNVKESLLQLQIWHGLKPAHLSPRTVALRLLETISLCAEGSLLVQVVQDLEQDLVSVAAECAEAGLDDGAEADYLLVIFGLEVLSSAGITPGAGLHGSHSSQQPVSTAKFLSKVLTKWPDKRGELEVATLKLAINTTNTEKGAVAFDDGDLLSRLASSIVEGIQRVQKSISNGRLEDDMYDGLLLVLGVMINIVEHYEAARKSVGTEPLAKLVALWAENRVSVSEADSVEKSKLSVALGYLAVLLGYLCLSRQGQEQIDKGGASGAGIRGLIDSIRDFADMYKTVVDNKAHGLEVLVNDLRRQAHAR